MTMYRWTAHPKPVTRVCYLPGSERVISGCRDGVVRVWQMGNDAPVTGTRFLLLLSLLCHTRLCR